MGAEWARLFKDVEINKILTIEASGIGMACIAAQHFGGVPVVFAKKAQSINLDGEQYATTIYSFTKQKEYPVIVGKRFLSEGDKVLIIDDFLANGCALEALSRSARLRVPRLPALASRWRRASKAVAISSASAASASRAWPVSPIWTATPARSPSLKRVTQAIGMRCDKGTFPLSHFCMRGGLYEGGVDMDENKMDARVCALCEMSVERLARDCEVQVFRATGPGGQGVNTTDSAVRMKHGPTGIVVTARESRSQFQNRASCLRKLRAELERRGRPPRRRVKTKVPQRSRQRRLNDKHFNAIKKANRRKPGGEE